MPALTHVHELFSFQQRSKSELGFSTSSCAVPKLYIQFKHLTIVFPPFLLDNMVILVLMVLNSIPDLKEKLETIFMNSSVCRAIETSS